jgi:hypothetical protein
MRAAGPKTKNNYARDSQQQFTDLLLTEKYGYGSRGAQNEK